MRPCLRLLPFLVLFTMLITASHASFIRSFLTMQIKINEDGSVDIRKEIRFYMDNQDSIDLYKVSLRTTNDLAGWKERTGLDDIRYHIDTSKAPVENVRIQPLAPDTCNSDQTACYGTFIFEFRVKAPGNGTGLVNVTKYVRPRTIRYQLRPEALSLDTALDGSQYIPERTSVEIIIPADSSNIAMSPKPVEFGDKIPNDAIKFTWQGRLGLANAELSLERKESLLLEVVNFFTDIQLSLYKWITSREGIAVGGAVVLIAVAYYLLQRRKVV